MARKRTSTTKRSVAVKFVDNDTGESLSITVFSGPGRLKDVAAIGEHALKVVWQTTSITDRRHARRF
jgi:hypothetical protein